MSIRFRSGGLLMRRGTFCARVARGVPVSE